VAALCASLAVAGCSGQLNTNEGRKVQSAVEAFALAHGPDACFMLTRAAIERVYGSRSEDLLAARARCLASSRRFRGQPVVVTFVNLNKPREAHATARTRDGRKYFAVGLVKLHGRWRIESVTGIQKPG
jgi:hypothetical protein